MQIREEMARRYWVLSRQWRGDPRFGAINVGEMLTGVADLAGSLNNIGWQRAETHAANLLSQVINNKRSRKRKDTKNVIRLMDHRVVQPRVLLDVVRTEGAEALVGQTFIMQIKQVG